MGAAAIPAVAVEAGFVNVRGGIPALVVLAAGVVAAAQSWNRWLDPIIDTGRDLYIPEQLMQGAKLYRDIRYQYPPLAPYLLAAITRVTGSSLASHLRWLLTSSPSLTRSPDASTTTNRRRGLTISFTERSSVAS